ncbi:MAG: putative nicotinamide N-methyase [Psychrobacter glaciei]|jgi:predicted nicotinamide N-methyase
MNNNKSNTMLESLQVQVNDLFKASVVSVSIPELNINLYLLDASIEKNQYSPEQVDSIWGNMPYWAFAWSSGRALAKYILDNPQLVKDKTICDFGAGSGIVALAALNAGAKAAWVCDLDQQALLASQLNAIENGMHVFTCTDVSEVIDLDLLVVGDVLYDPRNHKLAEHLFSQRLPLIWAESEAQTKLTHYGPVASYQAQTYPNLGGFDEHQDIHIYHHKI